MRASQSAKEFVQWASELRREERPLKELWVSTKCGESDTTSGCGANPTVGNAFDKLYPHGVTLVFGETTELTGGEHLVAARCRNDEVRKKFQFIFDRYQEVINRHKTSDLSDSQPTKGNIAGGLTTIEEKALGNIQKIGRKCVVDGVLDKAEMPTGPGLWFMDSSSAAAEMVTLCAAAGYVVHFFPTGQGNVIGNPILPVIKLCANPRTVRTMSEHIDVDVSGLLRKEMTPDQAGDKLLECMFRTANGRLTAAEALGHREFVLTRACTKSLEGLGLEGRRRRRLPGIRGPAPPEPDRARRSHLHPARARPDARLPLRLPGRHVRLVRDDGERRAALDLPHARRQGRGRTGLEIGALENLPVIRDLVTDMREFFDKWARAKGSSRAPNAARRFRSGKAGLAGPRPGRCRNRMHRLRRCATAPCDVVAWNPDYSARRRSTAHGPW